MYKRHPEHIGSVIEQLFNKLGYRERYRRAKVIGSWQEIVGEQIARVATAERIVGSRLFVRVADSTWRHELHLRRKEILYKINAYIGSKVVEDIQFQ
jgi:predicted nucleic acid-binding Zn ribbon protein